MRNCHFVTLLSLGLGLQLLAAGCANHEQPESSNPPPATHAEATVPAQENARDAATKLKEATDAESRGEYGKAMEAYVQLRSFPHQYQPNDLEQRIQNLKQKMDQH